MKMEFLATDTENVVKSTVRAVLSLGGHALAGYMLFAAASVNGEPNGDAQTPEWLTGIFALVITWYFATKERGNALLPRWQALQRSAVRATHAVGGGILMALLVIVHGPEAIPNWWVAIYVSILTFYFIELRDPPPTVGEPEPA